MARFGCKCGKELSNSTNPDIQLQVYTDKEWLQVLDLEMIEAWKIPNPPRSVWCCPDCERLYVFDDENRVTKFYVLEETVKNNKEKDKYSFKDCIDMLMKEKTPAKTDSITENDIEKKHHDAEEESETIEIDVSDCVSKEDVCELLEEKLDIPEWDEKKPDELLKNLKKLDDCEICIIGANLVPGNISSYVDNVVDILDTVDEKYGNISVVEMDVKTIDFTGCKYLGEVHLLIKKELGFPDRYGENLDALWDLLRRAEPMEINLKGLNGVSKELIPEIKKILEIFKRAEEECGNHRIIVE